MKKEEKIAIEPVEDATQYGEFVPSFHVWLTPEKQKETADRLANLKDRPVKKKLF